MFEWCQMEQSLRNRLVGWSIDAHRLRCYVQGYVNGCNVMPLTRVFSHTCFLLDDC